MAEETNTLPLDSASCGSQHPFGCCPSKFSLCCGHKSVTEDLFSIGPNSTKLSSEILLAINGDNPINNVKDAI